MTMAGKQKHSRRGKELIVGMKEAAAYARGEIELPTWVVEVPEAVDVAAIRKRLGLSQSRFAE
jgi:putative transcriptional regulator